MAPSRPLTDKIFRPAVHNRPLKGKLSPASSCNEIVSRVLGFSSNIRRLRSGIAFVILGSHNSIGVTSAH